MIERSERVLSAKIYSDQKRESERFQKKLEQSRILDVKLYKNNENKMNKRYFQDFNPHTTLLRFILQLNYNLVFTI